MGGTIINSPDPPVGQNPAIEPHSSHAATEAARVLHWNGRTLHAKAASAGSYRCRIQAQSQSGSRATALSGFTLRR
jgi:hypothetical protein